MWTSWRERTVRASGCPTTSPTHWTCGPGDQIELHLGDATVPVPVDGVYRALYAQPSTGYWRTWSEQLYVQCPDCAPPPQPILVDRAQLVSLSTQLGTPRARFALAAPVISEPITLDEARDLS